MILLDRELTLEEIARMWGMSRQAIHQQFEKIMKKLTRRVQISPTVKHELKLQLENVQEI